MFREGRARYTRPVAGPPTPGSDLRASRAQVLRASPPMFRSRTLDRLTRVHPAVPALLFGPIISLLVLHALQRMPAYDALLEILAGWVLWTLTEYWIHRTVFHFEPERGFGARLHWMIHGVHHDHPNDPMRLVMPPVLSLPIGAAFFVLFVLVLGTVGWAVCAGFFAGYLVYDMLHFALHHHRPRSRRVARSTSCTCAITSRTSAAGSASALPGGTSPSAPVRDAAQARPARPAASPRLHVVERLAACADPHRERRSRARPAGADAGCAAPVRATEASGRDRGCACGRRWPGEGAERRCGRASLLPVPGRSGISGSGCSRAGVRRGGPRRRCSREQSAPRLLRLIECGQPGRDRLDLPNITEVLGRLRRAGRLRDPGLRRDHRSRRAATTGRAAGWMCIS